MSYNKRSPGAVRDAIMACLEGAASGRSVRDIHAEVEARIGQTAASSVRSYLRLNSPEIFQRTGRGLYTLAAAADRLHEESQTMLHLAGRGASLGFSAELPVSTHATSRLFCADCFDWMESAASSSITAVVTDPPYGLIEYSEKEQGKLRAGRGGVWRIPPSFDGHRRSPLPRFTVLDANDIENLSEFFFRWGLALRRILVPGAHVLVASNPLLSYVVAAAMVRSGFERRGEIIRLTMTMRGGDRPKHAHEEFDEVSVMPRSMWEPWLIFRKPLDGRVQDNLRKWKAGGFRRPSKNQPFGDVIASGPTRSSERKLAPHPSLKPQAFLRQIVRSVLPLGEGIVLDPFAGSGSTLAAANAVGYKSVGVEKDPEYFRLATAAIPRLSTVAL